MQVIGGGLPVGAYGGRKDIMEMVAPAGPMYQAGTLSGNPLAMTAGIKVPRLCSDWYNKLLMGMPSFRKEVRRSISGVFFFPLNTFGTRSVF